MPPATLEAFRDHGRVRASLEDDVEGARDTMEILAQVGISMHEVTEKLLAEGVRLFAEPFDKLLDSLTQRGADRRARANEAKRN
jgi:transaldolase